MKVFTITLLLASLFYLFMGGFCLYSITTIGGLYSDEITSMSMFSCFTISSGIMLLLLLFSKRKSFFTYFLIVDIIGVVWSLTTMTTALHTINIIITILLFIIIFYSDAKNYLK